MSRVPFALLSFNAPQQASRPWSRRSRNVPEKTFSTVSMQVLKLGRGLQADQEMRLKPPSEWNGVFFVFPSRCLCYVIGQKSGVGVVHEKSGNVVHPVHLTKTPALGNEQRKKLA